MKRLRPSWNTLILLGSVFSGVGMMVLGYVGFSASVGQTYFILASLLFPFAVLPALVFWVLSLITFHWKSLVLSTLFFVLSAPMLAQTFAVHLKQPSDTSGSIQIMTYNADGFNGEEGKPLGLLGFIEAEKPDIICFQEFSVRPAQNGFTLEQLAEHLSAYPYYHFLYHHTTRFRSEVGTAIFSKFPIEGHEPIVYESRINSSCLYYINVRGKTLVLVNNHLESNGLTDVDMQLFRGLFKEFRWELKPLVEDIISEKIAVAGEKRLSQASLVMEQARKAGGDYVFLCGDLNDTPLSPTLRLFRKEFQDAFLNAGTGMGGTHRILRSVLRIDYILYSGDITPFSFKTGKIYYSDHYPVLCRFLLH